jgi:hypothetical protein
MSVNACSSTMILTRYGLRAAPCWMPKPLGWRAIQT